MRIVYRNDLEALEARHAALDREIRERTAERDELRRLIAPPLLATIQVASPCSADWNAMEGDDRERHCSICSKSVYNLSAMTRADAEAVIVEREGKLCVRLFQRKDGTILLQDCEVGVWKRRHRRIAAAALAAGAAAAGYGLIHQAPPLPPWHVELVETSMGEYSRADPPDVPDDNTIDSAPLLGELRAGAR